MKKIIYADAPQDAQESLLSAQRIVDDLPAPNELRRKTPRKKITISLDMESIAFFKAQAKKHKTKYQTMINEILGSYSQKYAAKTR